MAGTRIAVQIRATPSDDGDVRFGGFLEQLNAVRKALSETERIVTQGEDTQAVDFKVVDLRHSNPALVVLEAIPGTGTPETAEAITDTFFQGLIQIAVGKAPPEFDYYALDAFKELTGLVGEDRDIAELVFSHNGGEEVRIAKCVLRLLLIVF